jgi:hypothetical protein
MDGWIEYVDAKPDPKLQYSGKLETK